MTSAPKLEIDNSKVQQQDPMRYGLPTEEEIKQVVRGEHPQSGAFSLTLDELVEHVASIASGKHGVEAKVREVAARRCKEIDGDGKRYLKWV